MLIGPLDRFAIDCRPYGRQKFDKCVIDVRWMFAGWTFDRCSVGCRWMSVVRWSFIGFSLDIDSCSPDVRLTAIGFALDFHRMYIRWIFDTHDRSVPPCLCGRVAHVSSSMCIDCHPAPTTNHPLIPLDYAPYADKQPKPQHDHAWWRPHGGVGDYGMSHRPPRQM